MRVETPQILWHSEEDKGLNAALTSVSMLQSGIVDGSATTAVQYGHVLATAGNSNLIHLWKLTLPTVSESSTTPNKPMFQKQTTTPLSASGGSNNNNSTKIEFLYALTRHDGPVNAIEFSPDGLHLATAGETGSLIVYSVPLQKRGNGNGRHFWATAGREQELAVRILHAAGEGISDVSWSADSKRFMAGSIDHSVLVCEWEDPDWRVVYKNAMDHTHYVQGVSYDPLGVYLASMSSDRSVRVHTRKAPKKLLKKNNGNAKKNNKSSTAAANDEPGTATGSSTPVATSVQDVLTETKLEMAGRSKEIRRVRKPDGSRVALYCDESTLQSFVRRLSWTVDGAFLVTPAAVAGSGYATLVFARHCYEEPFRILGGLEKPSVAVRPNPVLFEIPTDDTGHVDDTKENQAPDPENSSLSSSVLAYRSIFCVLTWDTVLIYDTHHKRPLSIIRGLHYANLVDATWSADGQTLIVCSTDGYLSLIQFAPGELGTVYHPPGSSVVPPPSSILSKPTEMPKTTTTSSTLPMPSSAPLPPCEPGPIHVLEPRPSKKAKRMLSPAKRPADDEATVTAVDQLSLHDVTDDGDNKKNQEQQPPQQQQQGEDALCNKKKKKRIQPTLLVQS